MYQFWRTVRPLVQTFAVVAGLALGLDGVAQSVRILGGNDATQDWSWMAKIIDASAENPVAPEAHTCGATLVHPYWVVTAAHCVEDAVPSEIDVVLGAQSEDQTEGLFRFPVAEIYLHPDFTPFTDDDLEHDIALLLLAEPAEGFAPIPLVSDSTLTEEGVLARVLGWGSLDDNPNSDLAMTLQEADLPIVELTVANHVRSYDGELTENMLPAGFHKGRVDSCQGDSGGPLVVPDETGQGWQLAGITSFGNGCGDPFQYGIYTRVSAYRSWVLDHIHPDYGAWERSHGVFGEYGDPDDDGRNNFAEYAANSDPLDSNSTGALQFVIPGEARPIRPVLSFRQRATAVELETVFFYSSDLVSWVAVNPDEIVREVELIDENTRQVRVELPLLTFGNQTGFFRMETTFSGALEPFTAPIELGQVVNGSLFGNGNPSGGGDSESFRDFRLSMPENDLGIVFHVSSEAFPPSLEVFDRQSMERLAQEDTAEPDSTVTIQVPPGGTTEYLLRVRSTVPDTLGAFVLRSTVLPTQTIRPGIVSTGRLSRGDLNHYTLFGLAEPVDAFLLDGIPESHSFEVSVESGDFPTAVELIDGATGETLDSDFAIFLFDDSLGSSVRGARLGGDGTYIVLVSGTDETQFGRYAVTLRTEEILAPGEQMDQEIGPGGSLEGIVTRADSSRDNLSGESFPGDLIALIGIQPNREVTIDLESPDFDTYLWVIDAATGEMVDGNDDFGDTLNSQLTFTIPEDRDVSDFQLFVTSAFGDEFGDYALAVSEERIPVPGDTSIKPIGVGESIDGTLAPNDTSLLDSLGEFVRADQYDLVEIEPLQRLIIDLESDDFDAFLWLTDVENDEIIQEDDDSGTDFNSRIIFTVPADREGAVFRIVVTSVFGGDVGEYRLTVEDGEMVDPANSAAEEVTVGESIQGRIDEDDATRRDDFGFSYVGDLYELVGVASQHWVTLGLESEEIDPYLWLIDGRTGAIVAENDDVGFGLNSRLRFILPEGRDQGDFQVYVTTAFGNPFGSYELRTESEQADTIEVGARVESSLGREDDVDPDYSGFGGTYYMEEFVLSSHEPGNDIQLRMTAESFAAEVYVIDALSGETVAWSRATPSPTATVSFSREPGLSYLIRATSKLERARGAYTLEVTAVPELGQL